MATADGDRNGAGAGGREQEQGRGRRAIPVRGWKLRFDAPPAGGPPPGADQGDILALFPGPASTPPPGSPPRPERRRGPRYAPAQTRARVGWWKGPRFVVAEAELVNLSRGGALVALHRRPPTSQPVWVCLGSPETVVQVQARVQEVTPQERGLRRARLAFHTPCPLSFFLAAGRRDPAPGDTPA